MNLIGWLAIAAWTAVICVPMFGILKLTKMLRVDREIELKGAALPSPLPSYLNLTLLYYFSVLYPLLILRIRSYMPT